MKARGARRCARASAAPGQLARTPASEPALPATEHQGSRVGPLPPWPSGHPGLLAHDSTRPAGRPLGWVQITRRSSPRGGPVLLADYHPSRGLRPPWRRPGPAGATRSPCSSPTTGRWHDGQVLARRPKRVAPVWNDSTGRTQMVVQKPFRLGVALTLSQESRDAGLPATSTARSSVVGGKLIRRRECRHCGKRPQDVPSGRMTTWERPIGG